MNHSIETSQPDPAEADDLAQVRAAGILLALVARHADLPALTWSVDPAGHVVGCRTAGPDADVAADLGAWAAALDAAVTATPHRCDGRITYRARVDLAGTDRSDPGAEPIPVTITGVGIVARVPASLPIYTRAGRAAGMNQAQLDGYACVRCGLVNPVCSTPVAIVADYGQVFACSPTCPQPDPTDPAEDEPQPHPDWRMVMTDGRYERTVIGTMWAVELLDDTEISPVDDPGSGAYLYGPGQWVRGRRVGDDLAAGLLAADRAIGEWAVGVAAAIGEQRQARE